LSRRAAPASFGDQREQPDQTVDQPIRMALGATEDSVVRGVVRSGAVLLGAGIVIGLAASRVTNGLVLSTVVPGSSDTDATLSVVAAVAVVAVIGLAACLIAARRASRISPMTALRQD
jgi:putative ABC transport system permease protein